MHQREYRLDVIGIGNEIVHLVWVYRHVVQFLFSRTPLHVQQIRITEQAFERTIDDSQRLIGIRKLKTNRSRKALIHKLAMSTVLN